MRTSANTAGNTGELRLRSFHITFFAIVLGLAGFSLAVQKLAGQAGEGIVPALAVPATGLVYLTLGCFALVAFIYLAKAIRYPTALRDEIRHPVKLSFFPLVAKILLVLGVIFLERSMQASFGFWIAGVVLQLLASLTIMSLWIHHQHFRIEHMTPGWFIPIVGSLMIPIAGIPHGFVEISWFFFAAGLVFWLVLFTIVVYRLIFHPPIPGRLMPTLAILFAPPAIAFIAYSKLAGLGEQVVGVDGFARILYYVSLFLLLLVLFRLQAFARLRFTLSWWAYSFPLAAQALATMRMFHLTHVPFYKWLAVTEVALLAMIVAGLGFLTLRAVSHREICVEE